MPELPVPASSGWLRFCTVISLCLALCACNFDGAFSEGDGGSSSSSSSSGGGSSSSSSGGGTGIETEGIFNGGKISGLRYTTPSFTGLTDSSGTYRYRDGEDVSFSLGGVELGSARGTPSLNLFDLVNSGLIAEEALVRAALEDRQRIDALDQVANMALFLVTLDRDRDPSSGIDLGGWDSELADYQVDFEYDFYVFPERRGLDALRAIRTAFDIDYQVTLAAPLIFLYDALGVVIPAHVPERETTDDGNDSIVEFETTYTYNSLGLPEEIHRFRRPGTGAISHQWRRYTYDVEGRRIFSELETETNGDSRIDSFFRDEKNYNNAGLLIGEGTESGEYLVNERTIAVYQYDGGGNQTFYRIERDEGANGIVDDTFEVTSQYDSNGLLRFSEEETDADANGRFNRRQRFEYLYASNGLLISFIHTLDQSDTQLDGVVDARSETTYKYDGAKQLVEEVQQIDIDADGIIDSEYRITRSYDQFGQLVEEVRASDSNGDGRVESRQTWLFDYYTSGNVERVEVRLDENVDGFTDRADITEYEYNNRGQLRLLESFSRNSGGVAVRNFFDRRTYGDSGEPLTRLTDADGSATSIDDQVMQRWRYTEIADGLRFLVDYYRLYPGIEVFAESCLVLLGVQGGAVCEKPFVLPENN